MTKSTTKSQDVASDVSALLRARMPLIWIVTREEQRVEGYLMQAAASASYETKTWDVAQGVCDADGESVNADALSPDAALALIRSASEGGEDRAVWIMRDLPVWLQGTPGATPCRQLRNLARSLPSTQTANSQAIVVMTPSSVIPDELAGHATMIEWPLPDRAEIAGILDAALAALPEFETDPTTKQPDPTRPLRALAAPNGQRDAAIDAAVGLSGEEAEACYARSLVQLRRIDPATVAKEKRRVISREKVLEWFDPIEGGLESVGGLENLKSWLKSRSSAYSPAARAYGLPAPKGALLVGVSGCGKSLLAKATATAWSCPLLRMDLGALKSKFVGESEGNLRKALRQIEAIGRCVLWIDEIEKALQGSTSGSADGGVSADALGTLLTWMQERKSDAFVIATANNAETLPPELFRRFDEVWFVDLPNREERVAVLSASLRSHNRGDLPLGLDKVAAACDTFSGAEVAEIVPDAMFAAFADGGREITTEDLLAVAAEVVPLSDTAGDKIKALREWAKGKARPATKAETNEPKAKTGRALDLS